MIYSSYDPMQLDKQHFQREVRVTTLLVLLELSAIAPRPLDKSGSMGGTASFTRPVKIRGGIVGLIFGCPDPPLKKLGEIGGLVANDSLSGDPTLSESLCSSLLDTKFMGLTLFERVYVQSKDCDAGLLKLKGGECSFRENDAFAAPSTEEEPPETVTDRKLPW